MSWLSGFEIPFSTQPIQITPPKEPNWSVQEITVLNDCINRLLSLGAIGMAEKLHDQYLSNIFAVPKSDGTSRLVLNLKSLNAFVLADHFKLEDQKTVARIIKQNMFLAKLDLKDAYFLIPIIKSHRKYLRFKFLNVIYEFNCLPFGLNCAPYVFTKLMKPVVTFLRKRNYWSVIYLDDFLLLGNTYTECQRNVRMTIKLLENLGFLINFQKSVLVPSQSCQYLGFIYNTLDLTISLPDKKKMELLKIIESFMNKKSCKIQEFAKLLGKLVSACPAVQYGWLHLKPLERIKYLELRNSDNNFDAIMQIPSYSLYIFSWWLSNIPSSWQSLRQPRYSMEIFSDASLTGWGVYCKGKSTHGYWSENEQKMPINYLELKAAFFGLKCFAENVRGSNILLRIDNTTAIAYINKMGGIRFKYLNTLCQKIWHWCEARNLIIFASYIKSAENKEADACSRILHIETEWELNDIYFKQILQSFPEPNIDIFASRINKKCKTFISWHKDPEAMDVDAFTLNWSHLKFYAFPPFSIILKTLQKIIADEAQGIVIVPDWPSQPWYPIFHSLLISRPIIFKPNKNLLLSVDRKTAHPLWPQLTLVAGILSGKHYS